MDNRYRSSIPHGAKERPVAESRETGRTNSLGGCTITSGETECWYRGKERAEELWYLIFDPDEDRPLAEILKPEERPAVADGISRYLTRFERATGRRAPPGKALAYKFATNDGWLITPGECRAIATGLAGALARRRRKLIRGLAARGYDRTEESVARLLEPWAQYNRFAADQGGYRIW